MIYSFLCVSLLLSARVRRFSNPRVHDFLGSRTLQLYDWIGPFSQYSEKLVLHIKNFSLHRPTGPIQSLSYNVHMSAGSVIELQSWTLRLYVWIDPFGRFSENSVLHTQNFSLHQPTGPIQSPSGNVRPSVVPYFASRKTFKKSSFFSSPVISESSGGTLNVTQEQE